MVLKISIGITYIVVHSDIVIRAGGIDISARHGDGNQYNTKVTQPYFETKTVIFFVG